MSWTTTTIGEVCEVVSGATPKSNNPRYWDGEVAWVSPKDLSNLDQKYLEDTPRKITNEGFRSCSAKMLPEKSVLFSSRAPIGLVAINNITVCTNQGFKSMVPKSNKIFTDYLYWWLKIHRKAIEQLGRGATFKEVSKKIVEGITIPLPPLEEQKRIAGILDAADALRAKRRETLEQLDQLAQSTFLEMFGDPVTNPKGWEKKLLESLIVNGPQNGLYKPSKNYGSGTRILRIDGFYNGKVTASENLKRVQISAAESEIYGLAEDDIIINRVNSREYLGKSALIRSLDEITVYESNMMRFSLDKSRVHPRFFIEFLQTQCVKNQILRAAKDAVNQSSINQKDVKGFYSYIPPLSLQKEFASIIESIEKQKERVKAHLEELDMLFSSLQSRAFKGEL